MCEPDAEMNEKYAASVKRIEGELEQARSARSTTAWDAHGGGRGEGVSPPVSREVARFSVKNAIFAVICSSREIYISVVLLISLG